MSEILLHTCCGPCTVSVRADLKGRGFELTGFFYNPNIMPAEEYTYRRQAMGRFAELVGLDVIYQEDRPGFSAGACVDCYRARLRATAQKARELGFPLFTTTLLISPYQQHELIRQIGEEAGDLAGIEFYYHDFRPLFRQGQKAAREMGLYMQKYCGCGAPQSAGRRREYAEVG